MSAGGDDDEAVTIFVCGRKPLAGAASCDCGRRSARLCGFPLRGPRAGEICGRPICDRCTMFSAVYGAMCGPHARLVVAKGSK